MMDGHSCLRYDGSFFSYNFDNLGEQSRFFFRVLLMDCCKSYKKFVGVVPF